MRICVVGAPSTGKSSFVRALTAELCAQGNTCQHVAEYAHRYIQEAGSPQEPWEQLIIATGQHLEEQKATTGCLLTDTPAFATYVYALRHHSPSGESLTAPKHHQALEVLRLLAHRSVASYDLIFLLTHVFPPANGTTSLSRPECQAINREFELYLQEEHVEYHRLKANDSAALPRALQLIGQRSLIRVALPTPA